MLYSSWTSIGSRPRRCLVAMLLATLALSGCRDKTPVILNQLDAFGTEVDLSLVGVSKEQAQQASAIVAQDFAFLERDWTAGSFGQLDRVNRLLATGESFVAPPSLQPLLRRCKDYENRSHGLFNPGLGKLMELWGFRGDSPTGQAPPSAQAIAQLVEAKPSLEQLEIQGLRLKATNPQLALDLTPIARSYAIDLAMKHLMDLGIRNAMIQAGGELRAIGDRSGQPWRIPIRRASGSGVFAIVSVRGDESVVTRAAYDRNFIFKGKLYPAIIDPRTGWPADQVRSATVVQDSAAAAAATATALFVAGPERWPKIAQQMDARYVVLIDMAGRVHMTQAMADRIELVDSREEILIPGDAIAGLTNPAGADL
ncbi:FAD:protein FMN transferase [Thiorhodococcus mannitoliphagus]|uniref:FAD:protein FMN transferase n=1 Tax=Thiorhodococcus mannitoliphagus TaxID=329406 RepID=A0A6P1DVW2_9GAMM|nr:FAD:protein FMN transferase [Thiorhodococcus mannitoliphagus]NEX22278.1 FAD:protein FMN transferase [Thiorhodococcus mannitoliphagus]